jgi:thiamine-phosphate pyrophosphorylase
MDGLRSLPEEERDWFRLLGASVHSVEEAREAEKLGADYVTASHIFPTACKEVLAPRGLSFLQEVKQAVTIPVYALGGIHREQIALCRSAGADGVCMMSEFMTRSFGA